MGTIAEKLTYLNTTKIKLRDSLNKFGSSILSTDTFRSYDTKLNEIYDKLPKVTQSGAGLTISNVQNGLLDDFKMNGVDLEQDTTTGKNLFDKDNANIITAYIGDSYNWVFSGSAICYRINCKPNTSYTISCANSNETIFRGSVTDSEDIPTSGNNLSIYSTVRRTNNSPITVNTGANAKYVLVQLSNTQYLTSLETLQVEEGSSVTSYEPYTGGIPSPNPDYPQEIKVVEGRQVITDKGKNLLNKNLIDLGYAYTYGTTGEVPHANANNTRATISPTNAILVEPNTSYTINHDSTWRIAIAEMKNDLESLGDTGWLTYNQMPYTITTKATTKYLAFNLSKADNTAITNEEFQTFLNSNIIICQETSINNYEPYYEPVDYNIDLHGKNIFDGQYEDGYYNMNGTKPSTQDPYGRRSTNLNEIKPNTNYIISINNNIISEAIRVFFYDANRGFISTESISNGTFTSPAECYYVSWHSSSLKQNYPDGIPNMMIEQGQTVTTYEDYYDYKLAKMPNTDYKNRIYKNNGNWYFEKNIEKIVIDEKTSTPNINSSSNNTIRLLYSKLLSNNKSIADNPDIVSNYLIGKIMWNIDSEGIYSNNNDLVMRMNKSTVGNTLNSVLDWLSTHNVEIWYPLATPVTTQITNTTLINQLEAISVHTGTNIITISNDNNIIPEIEITRLKELEKLA